MLSLYVRTLTSLQILGQRATQRGAVASEYAILLALIAVLLVTAVGTLRTAIQGALTGAAAAINN